MASIVFLGFIVYSLYLAIRSRRGGGEQQSVHDFFVASRQFGAWLVFFLAAGELLRLGSSSARRARTFASVSKISSLALAETVVGSRSARVSCILSKWAESRSRRPEVSPSILFIRPNISFAT